jgi:hypothetical protein
LEKSRFGRASGRSSSITSSLTGATPPFTSLAFGGGACLVAALPPMGAAVDDA